MEQGKLLSHSEKTGKDYLKTVDNEEINKAKDNIEEWLEKNYVSGKTVLDIGSGSGIHSLAFYLLGAKTVYSLILINTV